MKRLLLAATVMSAASATNAQDSFGPSDLGLSPDAIRSIQVRLADNATGACWTNLQEVREYLRLTRALVNDNRKYWQGVPRVYLRDEFVSGLLPMIAAQSSYSLTVHRLAVQAT
jgi:hypothetical protein